MKASRIIRWAIPLALLALSLAAWLYVRAITPQLQLGVGYAARVACGCRYLGNRGLDSCHADFEPGMAAIRLSENAATRTVIAYVPLIASRSVTFDPVLGCQPEPFRGWAAAAR